MYARRLLAAAALSALATVPALADTATGEGAKALGGSLAAYFGQSVLDRGIVAVAPKGEAYEVTLDAQPALDALKLAPDSLRIGRWSFLVAPAADGKWKVNSESFPNISLHLLLPQGELTEAITVDAPHLDGLYDPRLGAFESFRNSFDAIGVTGKVQGMDLDLRMSQLLVESHGAAAGDEAVTIGIHQTIKSMVETLKMEAPAKPGAPATPPINITYDFGASTGDATLEAVRAKGLLGLWAFLVAEGAEGMAEHQDELKGKLRATLPLWKNLKASAQVADFAARTPFGTFAMKSLAETLGLSGLTQQGSAEFGFKIDGLSLASPLLPSWSSLLVPSALDLDLSVSVADVDKIAALMIDDFDLKADPPLSEAAQAGIAATLLTGEPKLRIAPGHLVSPSYALAFEGEFNLASPKPTGRITIEAEGLDKTLAGLKEAGKSDARAQQAAASIAFATGLAKPGADGKLVWAIDFGPDGVPTINGQGLGPPAK
ncbi:hypothetical protein SAMN05519103_05488 [Rhizobiales bacterium GAS113]|nr:hypothetical protein SAMN05519103_05488 [Rhizobiales bacterium GAS113]